MAIRIVTHRSLADVVTGKIATCILDGTYPPETQAPGRKGIGCGIWR